MFYCGQILEAYIMTDWGSASLLIFNQSHEEVSYYVVHSCWVVSYISTSHGGAVITCFQLTKRTWLCYRAVKSLRSMLDISVFMRLNCHSQNCQSPNHPHPFIYQKISSRKHIYHKENYWGRSEGTCKSNRTLFLNIICGVELEGLPFSLFTNVGMSGVENHNGNSH